MRRTMIHLEGIHKSFGSRHILRGVDLPVLEGETVCIMGGSGTGKSVTLKHVMRLLDPDKGKIWLDGQDITDVTGRALQAARAKLGVNFQFGALLNWLTVFENVALPLRENTRMSEPEIERRVMAKLELLNIPHAREQFPDQISGGMRKRAGLARAVVMEESVKVILYDEPTSGLDPISTAMVDEMVNEMRTRLGLTQVIVTHDLASAFRTADRVAMLHEGRVVAYDTLDGILASTHPFVVDFIGRHHAEPGHGAPPARPGAPAAAPQQTAPGTEPAPATVEVRPAAPAPGAPPQRAPEATRAPGSPADPSPPAARAPDRAPPARPAAAPAREDPFASEDTFESGEGEVFLVSSDSGRLVLGDTESQRVSVLGASTSGRLDVGAEGASELGPVLELDGPDAGAPGAGPEDPAPGAPA